MFARRWHAIEIEGIVCPVYDFAGVTLRDIEMSNAAEAWIMIQMMDFVNFMAEAGIQSWDSLKRSNWTFCTVTQRPKCVDFGDAEVKRVVLPYNMVVHASNMIVSEEVRAVYDSVAKKAMRKADTKRQYAYLKTQTAAEFKGTFVEIKAALQRRFHAHGIDMRSLLRASIVAIDGLVRKARTLELKHHAAICEYHAAVCMAAVHVTVAERAFFFF